MASGDGILKWVTVFDKDNAKDMDVDIPDIDKVLSKENGGGKKDKRLSVERIYQKKSQLEHILLRPDTYIGSVEKVTQSMWVYDDLEEAMVQREITYVPGLYKIFDEILVNAADNKQRDPQGMNCIKIDIDPENNKLKIWNNGKGIPVIEHKTEKMYVPTMIFGHLLTSSNYDDSQKKVTGGRNGYGAKLCNIFSTKFVVETQCAEYKKAFKQTWSSNMTKTSDPKIVGNKGDDYTCITFSPDLAKFGMEILDKDIVDLFTRRAYDIAASSKNVKVFLNGKKLPVKNFKDYVEIYTKGKVDDSGAPLKVIYESVNDRWEVALTLSEKGFQQVSFVNSIATTKGGRHVDYVTDHLVTQLIAMVKKKEKKGGIQIKPFQVKNHVWVFVNCLIENPTFDSQTKENMTLQAKSFGSHCKMSEKFITQVSKCGIVEAIMSWMKFKQQAQLNKKMSSAKHSKLKGIPKLDDANNAGTKNSTECTLILTEGDSAKTLAVAGLGVIGRDKYGVFPLRGKVLNVREATHKQIMENAETNNLIKILGLRYKEKYDTPESMKTLRYGKVMIMTDQDQDGSHIKGLLINFIHHNWPHLLKQRFVEEFITPIVKVSKGKTEHSFYSLPEFEEWKKEIDTWHTWKVKYYKGLGTSTSKEAKEYFSDMHRHRIPFKYQGGEDDAAIVLAFSKKKIEERKEWLTNWMEERKRRAQLDLPEIYLYGKETKSISYNEFVNRELILFSNMDNERSIPSLVDGFKPGQRKVLFACLKRNLIKEVKVAQLAGSVAEHSSYHHGEQSLMSTIINLAQNFVGSNNINLLQPCGQFGTRLHGGKDSASPRYIFTLLSQMTRHIFNPNDDALLKSQYDDNQRIEPVWYMPILPMILVNGADGIGTGWSTKIPNHDPREIVANILRMLEGEDPLPMLPSFKNFKGTIEQLEDNKFVFNGEVSIIDDQTIEITELPVKTWTQVYKENVLEPMLQGTEKTQPFITDYKEYHTDTTVKFVIKMTAEKMATAEEQGLHKVFKLQTTMSTASMVLFDSNGCIRRYNNVDEILKEFFELRMDYYRRRKDYLEGMLAAESLKLDNIARFICEKIDGTIVIENKPKKEIIRMLTQRGFDPDPVKTWKESQNKLQALEEFGGEDEDDSQSTASAANTGSDFNYLMSLPLWNLTKEKKDELLKQRDTKAEELYQLRKKSPKDLWKSDLNAFKTTLDELEQKERDDETGASAALAKKTGKAGKGRTNKVFASETRPSPMGRRVEPRIDPALRAKAEAAAAKKKKAQVKRETGLMDTDSLFDDEESAPKSLADRLGMKSDQLGKKNSKSQPNIKDAFTKAPVKKESVQQVDSDSEPDMKKTAKKLKMMSDDSDVEDLTIDSINSSTQSAKKSVSPTMRMDLSPDKSASKKGKGRAGGGAGGGGGRKKRAKEYDSDDLAYEDNFRKSPKKAKKPFDSDSEDDSPGKKKKKRKLSDEEDFELDDEIRLEVAPRERVGRSRKAINYNLGGDSGSDVEAEENGLDDDDDGGDDAGSYKPESRGSSPVPKDDSPVKESHVILDSDDDTPVKRPPLKMKIQAKALTAVSDSEDEFKPQDDSDDEYSPKPKSKAPKKYADSDSDGLWGGSEPAAKKAAPKKKSVESDDDLWGEIKATKKPPPKMRTDSDDDDDSFGAKPTTKPVAKKPAPKKISADSDDEDMFGEKPKKAPAKKAPAKKKVMSDSDDDDIFGGKPKKAPAKKAPAKKKVMSGSDDEDFFGEKPKKAAPKKRAPKKKKESDDEDIFGDKPKKAAPKKRAPKKKPAPAFSESEDEFAPKAKSTAAKKSKKTDSDDDDFGDLNSIMPRATTGRSRQPVKYNFGEDDEEGDSDY